MATGLGTTTQNGLTGTLSKKLTVSPSTSIPWWGKQELKWVGAATGFQTPPSAWDVLLFGPNKQPLPGLVRVRRCARRMKLHRKEHPAADFETQTFQGWSVVEFDFELIIWSQYQLAALQNALGYFFPGAGDPPDPTSSISVLVVSSTQNIVNPQNAGASGTSSGQQIQTRPNVPKRPPIPVKVSHPALQMHGVDAVVFEAMDGPLQMSPDKPDIFMVRFKTVQFKPSQPVAVKTLDRASTRATNLGAVPPPGVGVLQPQYLQPPQQESQPPSASGGANPDFAAQYTNFLPGPVS